jgi:hypothetical protein
MVSRVSPIGLAALVLWALTLAAAAYFFVFGTASPAPDGRLQVALTVAEREHVLSEMRGLLQAASSIVDALARNDIKAIAETAGPVGMAATAGESPALLANFKASGMRIHAGFDDIAREAGAGAPPERLTRMLAEQLSRCVACHASYRFAQ